MKWNQVLPSRCGVELVYIMTWDWKQDWIWDYLSYFGRFRCYLVSSCRRLYTLCASRITTKTLISLVWQIILEVILSNPVLEAFGNAKIVRNNNSSRFGKFVEIQFDKHGRISGAAIRTYLLERSPVCQTSDPERNYHCFYLLCAAPREELDKYKLGHPKTFHYLNQSNCYELVGISDAHDYLATRRAIDIVRISQKEQGEQEAY